MHIKTLGSAADAGVVLAGGDLDQALGLLDLRGLERLTRLSQQHKVYVHINNANPILDKDFPRYRKVREAGWDVAEDGWEFRLRRTKPPLAF